MPPKTSYTSYKNDLKLNGTPETKGTEYTMEIEAKAMKGNYPIKNKSIRVKLGGKKLKDSSTDDKGEFVYKYKDKISDKEKTVTLRFLLSADPEEIEKTYTFTIPAASSALPDELPNLYVKHYYKKRGNKHLFNVLVLPAGEFDIQIEEGEQLKQTLSTDSNGHLDDYEAQEFTEEKRLFVFTLIDPVLGKPTIKQYSICLNGPKKKEQKLPEPVSLAEIDAKVKKGRRCESKYLLDVFKTTRKTVKAREKLV
jgi:hypothetical protein